VLYFSRYHRWLFISLGHSTQINFERNDKNVSFFPKILDEGIMIKYNGKNNIIERLFAENYHSIL